MRYFIIFILLVFTSYVYSQITINVEDMEYEIGGYYEMYGIDGLCSVSGLTGIIGGPHEFDFSSGYTTNIEIYDYVNVNDGGNGVNFPYAEIAERKTYDEEVYWHYLRFESGIGRINYGYSLIYSPELYPAVIYNPPVIDFPDSLTYQSYFEGTTSIDFIPDNPYPDVEFEHLYNGYVDAYGTIILPNNLGIHDCIQVNCEIEYIMYIMGTPETHHYQRFYYYLVEEIGIVVKIASEISNYPVPDNFDIAISLSRIFEFSKVPINDVSDSIYFPSSVKLNGNYPNPFNPTTTINYSLKENSKVELKIYNIKGQLIKTLVNEFKPAGEHSVIWNGTDDSGKPVSSGIYFYKLKAGDFQKVKKMVFLK
jgi:hypothetical protein